MNGRYHLSTLQITCWTKKQKIFFKHLKALCAGNVKSVNDNFPIFSWFWVKKLANFSVNCYNYRKWAWTGFHILELKWNVIPWNARNCFWAWIFNERKFTDPSPTPTFYINLSKLPESYFLIGCSIHIRILKIPG